MFDRDGGQIIKAAANNPSEPAHPLGKYLASISLLVFILTTQ